jgi:hypothetical protein
MPNVWPGHGSGTGQTIAAPSFKLQSGDVAAKAFQIVGGWLQGRRTTWGQCISPSRGIVSFPFGSCMSGPEPASGPGPGRHFMDERFRLPVVDGGEGRRVKIFRTVRASDGLQHAVAFWYRCFCSISAELESILEGRFTANVAKNGLPVRPIFRRNHPSWEDDPYAQEVLALVLSEWLNAGSLEYVERFHRLPHCILAVGSVNKNTHPFRRLVNDARPINMYAEGCRVKYATVSDICLILTQCSLIWARDLKNAYRLVRLGGCRGWTQKLLRWITEDGRGTGYVPSPTFRSGCGPGDCLGVCDKSIFGMCVAGHVARFAVAQFGHKVSNGPLWIITNAVCTHASRVHEVNSDSFVDDILNSVAVDLHEACNGLDGRCATCLALERALRKMEALDKMMKDCGLSTLSRAT